jgi:hypothetical protein
MANPKMLFTDVSSISYSALDTDASFPVSNLSDFEPATMWKGSSVSNPTNYIIADYGIATECTMCVIDNHNLSSFIGLRNGVKLEASSVADFSTDLHVVVADLAVSSSADPAVFTFESHTKRYWRVFWDNDADALNYAPQVGNIFIGTPLEFTTPYEWNYKTENAEYQTNTKTALDGTIRSSQTFAGRLLSELKFSNQSDTFRVAFQTFHRSIRGSMYPFYFIDVNGTTVRYVHMEDYVPVSVPGYGRNEVSSIRLRTHEASY